MSSDNESIEEENVFYFESDHLALRGNRDYANVLRTIAILEAQKVRVHKQIEELVLAKNRYLDDPELFLQKLRNNEEIIAPNYMTIAKLPEVGTYEHMPPEDVKDVKVKQETDSNTETTVIRGRIFDESKPETFNKLWTCEEQRRLEQLLIKFPVEAVEAQRFAKIAKALGNRTPQQVSSRVQKYFEKLYKAGMPIPGRIPKNRRGCTVKKRHYYRPTTFFPAQNVPEGVHMSEDDFLLDDLYSVSSPAAENTVDTAASSTYVADIEFQTDETYESTETRQRMLYMLQAIRDEKKSTSAAGYNIDPLAAKCNVCHSEPVLTRWRCNTCYCFLNQCGDCLVDQLLGKKFEHITHDVVVAKNET